MAQTDSTRKSEANVVLAMVPHPPMSFDVLDANSDDVLEAIEAHGRELALGAAVSLQMNEPTIMLRFDLLAASKADVYRQISEVMQIIEEHTDLCFERSHSDFRLHQVADDTPAAISA